MQIFISKAAEDPFFVFSWMLIIVFSICVHECSHAWAALRQGDDTAAAHGHLSLNPLVQMGWSSLVMLALFGLAWGAVPVDPRRLRGAWSAAWVAAAGPLSNLLLAVVFAALTVGAVYLPGESSEMVLHFFRLAAMANGVLFVFNLLPIPMFDGWTVLAAFVPPLRGVDPLRVQSYSWLLLLAVWVTPVGDVIWQAGRFVSTGAIMGWARLADLVT